MNLAAFVFVAILIFSPTVNRAAAGAPVLKLLVLTAAVLAAAALLKGYRWTRRGTRYTVAMLVLAALAAIPAYVAGWTVFTPVKVLSILLVTLCAAPLAGAAERRFLRTIVLAMAVTTIFVAAQLTGVAPRAFVFQDYANEAEPVNLLATRPVAIDRPVVVAYLPQLRPSGAFPSPTYIAVFCIFVWHQLIVNRRYQGRAGMFVGGALFVLIGSTLGVALAAATVLFISYKRRVLYCLAGSAATLAAYYWLSPYVFAYNFNFADVVYSFASRVDIEAGGESILQQKPWLVAAAAVAGAVMLLTLRRIKPYGLMRAGVAIALPVLVHDVSGSLMYWLMATLAVHALAPIRLVTRPADESAPAPKAAQAAV